jgi:hypothetical protein
MLEVTFRARTSRLLRHRWQVTFSGWGEKKVFSPVLEIVGFPHIEFLLVFFLK